MGAMLSVLLELSSQLGRRQTLEKLCGTTEDTKLTLWYLVHYLSPYSLKARFLDTTHHDRSYKMQINTTIWKETISKELKHT